MKKYKPGQGFVKKKPRIKPPRGVDIDGLVDMQPSDVDKVALAALRKRMTQLKAPKRPRSSYMCFVQRVGSRMRKEVSSTSYAPLGKLLGDKWNTMSAEEKRVRAAWRRGVAQP